LLGVFSSFPCSSLIKEANSVLPETTGYFPARKSIRIRDLDKIPEDSPVTFSLLIKFFDEFFLTPISPSP